jgi:hypothetical protein
MLFAGLPDGWDGVAAGQPVILGDSALRGCGTGVLVWPAERTLIVADLHLEKGSAFAARGQMLPPYDTRATLMRLAKAIERHAPRRVIALGDSFHDAGGPARLDTDDAQRLRALQKGRTWVWVSGNHDREIDSRIGGEAAAELCIQGITLRHEPSEDCEGPEIAGHLHPAARLVWGGASVRTRCFVSDGDRLVLPAFGAFAGGLNILSEPFAALFGGLPRHIDMIGRSGLYRVPASALVGD